MNNVNEFVSQCEKSYITSPEKFGFAFWKYRELILSADIYSKSYNGAKHYYAVNRNRLVYYWSEDGEMILPDEQIINMDLIYIHSKYKKHLEMLNDSHDVFCGKALIYDRNHSVDNRSSSYYAESFDFSQSGSAKEVCKIINGSGEKYSEIMTVNKLDSLKKQPVFASNLWVMIREKKTNKAVGVGICVYDEKIFETELEWIYVLRDYQGYGVGRYLLSEIVKRARSKSDIIRVGGVADGFYEKCGFTIKTDEWLWIKKKNTKVGWWD